MSVIHYIAKGSYRHDQLTDLKVGTLFFSITVGQHNHKGLHMKKTGVSMSGYDNKDEAWRDLVCKSRHAGNL